jgi:hypothetical protein
MGRTILNPARQDHIYVRTCSNVNPPARKDQSTVCNSSVSISRDAKMYFKLCVTGCGITVRFTSAATVVFWSPVNEYDAINGNQNIVPATDF